MTSGSLYLFRKRVTTMSVINWVEHSKRSRSLVRDIEQDHLSPAPEDAQCSKAMHRR